MTKRASAQDKLNRTSAPGAAASRARTEAALTPATIQRAIRGPGELTPSDMLSLQQTIGNRAVSRLIARSESGPAAPVVQAKLTVGAVDDPYEREADQMASQVTRSGAAPPARQQEAASERDEEDEIKEEEEMLQTKPQSGHGREGGDVDASVSNAIEGAKGRGQPLPDALRASMDSAFSADFGGVRVHSDSQSDALNQSLNARAFTTGSDIFFGGGQYNPASGAGKELIAHELTHTIQQGAAGVKRRSADRVTEAGAAQEPARDVEAPASATDAPAAEAIQRVFNPGRSTDRTHLRADGRWGRWRGPVIPAGQNLIVDDNDGKAKTQEHRDAEPTLWRPAVNVPAGHRDAVNANRVGYIRSSKATVGTGSLEADMRLRIEHTLTQAEGRHPDLGGHLNKPAHVDFLLDKALRYQAWNADAGLESFAAAFGTKEAKFARINAGAEYVADSLDHWRAWLYPEDKTQVEFVEVKLIQSDLHERGLGVVMVKFRKPAGGSNVKFAGQTEVGVMLKPEDKSLEENLLGDKAGSAVNEINRIAGLTEPDEMLTSIKMESTLNHGTLVELAKGASAEVIHDSGLDKPMKQSFHETLVFAFLAGIDDLHHENVFWNNGMPTLIDADNVLSRNQMQNVDNGALTQKGFGLNYNQGEAERNKNAISTGNNTVNSKILDKMLNDPERRLEIINVIKDAIRGKRGRVVPIRSRKWGEILKGYATVPDKAGIVNFYASRDYMVREGKPFNDAIGPGLFGVAGKNAASEFYGAPAEKRRLKHDLDAGTLPFYEYSFDTGVVTHNGERIYHGQTLEQAMDAMLTRFGG